ncbi:MAG TPA: hypothetical protein VIG24_14740 [Acidimicrobiia bacterium]
MRAYRWGSSARVLRRLPGSHTITVWTWALPLLLAMTMTPFTTTGPRASYWQQVSFQAYAVAAVVSGILLLVLRPRMRRMRATTSSGVLALLAYALVAAVSVMVAIAVLPALRAPDRPALIGSAESVLLYAIASAGAGGVAAWTLSWRAELRRALRDSRLRAAQAQRALDEQREFDTQLRAQGVDRVQGGVLSPLFELNSRLDQRDAEGIGEAAAELRAIATDVVRPLSHSLHPVETVAREDYDDAIGAGISWRRIHPLRQPLPVLGIWLLSVPGAVLIPATGPGPMWAAVPDLGVLVAGLLALRWLLGRGGDAPRPLQWLMLIAGLAVVGSAAGIAFGVALGEPWYSLIGTGAIVHVISGVAITLARGWGAAMRAETIKAQRATLLARTALTAEVVSIDASRRHAADILHSQVQTRLLAIADLLDFAAAGNDEDLQRARMEITNTCADTLPEVVRVLTGADEAEPSFDELVRGNWPGVDVRGGEVIDSLESGDGVLMGLAFDACANAVRHGGASVVVISRESADDGERLCIRDNGSGVPADMEPGLGLSAVAVHFPGWSITNSNGWTELALPLIADQVRGEPAIAR